MKTSSKQLVVVKPPDPKMAAQLHQCVLAAGAISAGSAVLCGLQLMADQKALKSASGCTFEQWLEQNKERLGFSRRTAFNYTSVARDTKSKLLKSRDPMVLRLLADSPANLMPDAREKLLDAVRKCMGGATLMEIYLEAGIVKDTHKAPKPTGNAPGESNSEPVSPEKQIEQLILFPLETLENGITGAVALGDDKIERWATMPHKQFHELERRLALAKENISELHRKVVEARKQAEAKKK